MNDPIPTNHPNEAPKMDNENWGVFIYLSSFIGLVVPLGHIIVPAILWIMKKEQNAFIYNVGKEVLNFNLSITLYVVILLMLSIVSAMTMVLLPLVLFIYPVIAVLGLVYIIYIIVGAIKTSKGTLFKLPFAIKFLR